MGKALRVAEGARPVARGRVAGGRVAAAAAAWAARESRAEGAPQDGLAASRDLQMPDQALAVGLPKPQAVAASAVPSPVAQMTASSHLLGLPSAGAPGGALQRVPAGCHARHGPRIPFEAGSGVDGPTSHPHRAADPIPHQSRASSASPAPASHLPCSRSHTTR